MENWKEEKVTLFPRRLFLRLAALALAAVLALGLTACDSLPDSGGHTVKPSTGSSQPFEMHFIDVGQALSVLVECDGQFMLYDGGNRGWSSCNMCSAPMLTRTMWAGLPP